MSRVKAYIIIDAEIEGFEIVLAAKISMLELNLLNDGQAIDFDFSNYRLQINLIAGEYKVNNAVNGYGQNCKRDFEEAIVKIVI